MLEIPRIMPQIYIPDVQLLRSAPSAGRYPPLNLQWPQSCREHHPDWQYKLWSLELGEVLLQTQYAWFLPFYEKYALNISKGELSPGVMSYGA